MKTVVSLFDGVSCGYMALKKVGIKFDKYIASEVDKFAQKASAYNFPDIERVGDVRNVSIKEPVWLLIGGSPCQSFSFAGKMNGMSTKDNIEVTTLEQYLKLKENSFEFEGQSYLFWEYVRILKETKPTFFFLENVEMPEKWEKLISKTLGVNPIKINSSLVSAQSRSRLYWTNIGLKPSGLFGDLKSIIPQPKDRGIFIKDILDDEVDEKYFVKGKALDYIQDKERLKKKYTQIDGDKAICFTAKMYQNCTGNYVKIDKKGNLKNNQEKASCFTAGANSGGNHSDMDLLVLPKCVEMRGRNPDNPKSRLPGEKLEQMIEPRNDGKSNCLTTVQKDNMVCIQKGHGFNKGGVFEDKAPTLTSNSWQDNNHLGVDYAIRRFTPREVCRLQTIPDNFFFDEQGNNIISDSRIYQTVGNGWNIETIVHIFNYLPK